MHPFQIRTLRAVSVFIVCATAITCAPLIPSSSSRSGTRGTTLDTCKLLPSMQTCWAKGGELLARLKSCGQLGQDYGEGVREELLKADASDPAGSAASAAFACAGLCAIHRGEPELGWTTACTTAAAAMKCDPGVCSDAQ